MDSNARPRAPRPAAAPDRAGADTLRPLCESSVPGMARYVRMRLRYHGYPSRPEVLSRVLSESYEAALGEVQVQQKVPGPGSFRKALTHQARAALYRAIEEDQQAHLSSVIEAFEAGHCDPWKGPVPQRSIAKLTRAVLDGIDEMQAPAERILLRALCTGTHTPAQRARLLDLPDLAPTLSRAVCSLLDALRHEDLPALPGLLQAFKGEVCAPPAAMLAVHPAKAREADRQRAAELRALGGLSSEEIAARMRKSADQVNELLADVGLEDRGPWHRAGGMFVDMAAFTRELEMRDLAVYMESLCEGREAESNWKLMNRHGKVLAFWLKNLLSRVSGSVYGSGLTGPWMRARLAAMRHGLGDFRKWLSDGGLTALEIGRASARSKLHPKLAGLFASSCKPAGPDLSRPLASLPAVRPDPGDEKQLSTHISRQIEKLLKAR